MDTMSFVYLRFSLWVLFMALLQSTTVLHGSQWCLEQGHRKFEQRASRFWGFNMELMRWEEVSLPFQLMSCVNQSCSTVGTIEAIHDGEPQDYKQSPTATGGEDTASESKVEHEQEDQDNNVLPARKRVSVTKMSDTSLWVTGQSGSVYERFWNGVQWVIAPHDVPPSVGYAVSVFIINRTVLVLSEAGLLYQIQLNENNQPFWSETKLMPQLEDREQTSVDRIKAGVISYNGEKLYLSSGMGLVELSELQPLRWSDHGIPPGVNSIAIVDAGNIREDAVFTVSSIGELYEYDKNSRPSWKKHIRGKTSEDVTLATSRGCVIKDLVAPHSRSLFLLTKNGSLIERRFHQRKWKWVAHGAPTGFHLSSVTPSEQNSIDENVVSLFITTTKGSVYEYRLSKNSGPSEWVNHLHPKHAKIARGIRGVQLQPGRMIFPLDDGRLAELHMSSIGGEHVGPAQQVNLRRKVTHKYEWSILDAPECEGWNAEYCTEKSGPVNCIAGSKDVTGDDEVEELSTQMLTRRRSMQSNQHYLPVKTNGSNEFELPDTMSMSTMNTHFCMRAMHTERSFFFISETGQTFEYQHDWSTHYKTGMWLRHEYPTAITGALGNYNGSMFLVDAYKNLLIRERNGNDLSWINCTSMKRGRHVVSGSPWDTMPGRDLKVTAEDALFFVSKKGKLLQFTVAFKKFKWKDCQRPSNTRIAHIIDHGTLRSSIVFAVGANGRLYQYNTVTSLWHEHQQSPHLILSPAPGAAIRPSEYSLTGSLFMASEDGGLVEYRWSGYDGWSWVEHGTPGRGVALAAPPGPCFEGWEVFVLGTDGGVYRRYLKDSVWKWDDVEYPHEGCVEDEADEKIESNDDDDDDDNEDNVRGKGNDGAGQVCDRKVAAVRPIPFSQDSVIFQLRDGRLAELRRLQNGDGTEWGWSRIIGTPGTTCPTDYWTAVAS